MNRRLTLILLLFAITACAPKYNGSRDRGRGHHVINIKLKPDDAGKCRVDSVRPEKKPGLKRLDTVFWRVANGCEDATEVTIAFDDLDPLYDYLDNPGHKKKIPGKGAIFDGTDDIRTAVRLKDPGGEEGKSKPYPYRVTIPGSEADPEIVVDWP